MEKFKYGIMVVDPLNPEDVDEDVTVIHFVGYWEEPENWDVEANRLREELRTDPDFEYYRDIIDRLLFYPATPDCLKYYNDMGEADGIFDDKNIWKEKMN
jgi:hypothetical protein